MGITSAIVLYAVIWFMVLFITLPLRLKTQGDVGKIVPGTHAGAPANLKLRRTFLIVTGVSLLIWAVIAGTIVFGLVSLDDLDIFKSLRPSAGRGG